MKSMLSLCLVLFGVILSVNAQGAVTTGCADGFTCWDDGAGTIWVKRDAGARGWSCAATCEHALCGTGDFHVCDHNRVLPRTLDEFEPIYTGLGVECREHTCPWYIAHAAAIQHNNGAGSKPMCPLPDSDEHAKVDCFKDMGNANCASARYSFACPCIARELENACFWPDTSAIQPTIAAWPTEEEVDEGGCLARVNYWRKRACDEGWPECPPCGLPPMSECVGCHECMNTKADTNFDSFDAGTGYHASNGRCGGSNENNGGGSQASCGAWIDNFLRNAEGNCHTHCNQFLAEGCTTMKWGKKPDNNRHTLQFYNCNEETCSDYCDSPNPEYPCYRVANSPPPPPSTTAVFPAPSPPSPPSSPSSPSPPSSPSSPSPPSSPSSPSPPSSPSSPSPPSSPSSPSPPSSPSSPSPPSSPTTPEEPSSPAGEGVIGGSSAPASDEDVQILKPHDDNSSAFVVVPSSVLLFSMGMLWFLIAGQ